jgi:single-strand DNA-binding protein
LDINHVVLVGRLTRDAELRYTNSGSAMAAISLAINTRRRRDDQWVDEAHFFDAVVWGKTAESLSPYLTKGKQIGLEGELRQNRWEQDGQRRSKVEIFTRNIQLLGSRGGDGMGAGPSPSGPPASGPPADRMGPESGPAGAESGPAEEFEDDIPF